MCYLYVTVQKWRSWRFGGKVSPCVSDSCSCNGLPLTMFRTGSTRVVCLHGLQRTALVRCAGNIWTFSINQSFLLFTSFERTIISDFFFFRVLLAKFSSDLHLNSYHVPRVVLGHYPCSLVNIQSCFTIHNAPGVVNSIPRAAALLLPCSCCFDRS